MPRARERSPERGGHGAAEGLEPDAAWQHQDGLVDHPRQEY